MSAGEFIFARLNGATAASNRVYPLLLPQPPIYPALTYLEVSQVRTHLMGQDSPLLRVRVQLDAWAKTYADARSLANEAAALLSRYRGTLGNAVVHDVLLDNDLTLYESETDTRRVTQDYTVFLTND